MQVEVYASARLSTSLAVRVLLRSRRSVSPSIHTCVTHRSGTIAVLDTVRASLNATHSPGCIAKCPIGARVIASEPV